MIPQNTLGTVYVGAGALLLGTLLGVGIGWKMYHPTELPETYAPAVVLKNDAVALERKPDQPPPTEIKVAAKELKGELIRSATVKLQPKPTKDSPVECECEPIILDLGVVDVGDGNRIVVHTDDAEVLGGNDNPIEPYKVAHEDRWEVGVIAPVDYFEGVGPTVARRIGPFKLGVAAMRQREEGWTGMVSATISF